MSCRPQSLVGRVVLVFFFSSHLGGITWQRLRRSIVARGVGLGLTQGRSPQPWAVQFLVEMHN